MRAWRVAQRLESLGALPGDRVVLRADKTPDLVECYLGCVLGGQVLVPLDPAATEGEAARLVADSAPALVLDDALVAELVAPGSRAGEPPTDPDAVADWLAERATGGPAPGDPAAILFTSGTTGRPKGAVLSQANLADNVDVLVAAWGFTSEDVLVHALPLFHAHGLFVAVNCVVAAGAAMVLLERFDVAAVLEALGEATVFMGVPTHYQRLLADERLDREVTGRMRLFCSGSAPLSASAHREFAARTGHEILERYGMTETLMIASNPLDGERRPGTVGRPLPGVDVRVVDRVAGGPVAPGAVGAIEVRGPSVFEGYWRLEEATGAAFTDDGHFRTGDLGSLDETGYLTLTGRARDLVITGGENVDPVEVEHALDALDGVRESAVVGGPDPDFGEVVVAFVVPVPGGASALTTEAVREALRGQLAGYKLPRRVEVVDELPRTPLGKVAKGELRRRLAPAPEEQG